MSKHEAESWGEIIIEIAVVIILFQVMWLIKKQVWNSDDCFWKSCVVVKQDET